MTDLRRELLSRVKPELIKALDRDEQAVIEAATGELGNKPDAVKLGWLKIGRRTRGRSSATR